MKVSRQRREQRRREGFAPNERALSRQLEAARQQRMVARIAAGLPRPDAESLARKEFAEYDLVEIDSESGWVRIRGLNFSREDP